MKVKTLVAGFVSVMSFFVFLPSLRNGFVNWDDDAYVYENFFIRSFDAQFFKRAFLNFYAANWHPLTWISHAVDYAVWGLNPVGHHLTSIFLHAMNTFLVVLLAVTLLRGSGERGERNGLPKSFFTDRGTLLAGAVAGTLFGLHPIHVESVVWVSERKDLLSAFFFLVSLRSYVKYVAGTENEARILEVFHNKHYLFSLAFFVLALSSKPMAVTLPVVLLILDWYPFKRMRSLRGARNVCMEKLPFFALSLVSSVVTFFAQRSGEAVVSLDVSPLSTRLIVAAQAVIWYLLKMICPVDLIPLYPYPHNVSFLSHQYLFPVLLVIAITSVVIVTNRKFWIAVWGYYVVTLLPVIGIVRVGFQSMADRYTYLPSLGPFLAMGVVSAWAYDRATSSGRRLLVKAIGAAAVVALISMSYMTQKQIRVWRNSLTLWNYVIEEKSKKVPVAYYHRGIAYSDERQYDMAIEDYATAIALKPNYFEAYINRGFAYSSQGQYDRAIEDYTAAISLRPDFRAYNNRGDAYISKGLFDMAIKDLNQAIRINPEFDSAYGNRGAAYYLSGRYREAVQDLSKAIELNKNNAAAYVSRGYVYLKTGNDRLALSDMQRGCDLGSENGCKMLQNLLNN